MFNTLLYAHALFLISARRVALVYVAYRYYMSFESQKRNGYAKTATLHKKGDVMFSYLRERAVWMWHADTGHLRPAYNGITMVYCFDADPIRKPIPPRNTNKKADPTQQVVYAY